MRGVLKSETGVLRPHFYFFVKPSRRFQLFFHANLEPEMNRMQIIKMYV